MLRTIRWRLIAGSLLAIGCPLLIFAPLASSLLWRFYTSQMASELRSEGMVIAAFAAPILSPRTPDDPEALARIVGHWRSRAGIRVTIADNTGIILAATNEADIGKKVIENERPGMPAALRGETNSTVWKNPSYGYQDTMYANVPVLDGKLTVGAVRVAYTLTQIQEKVRSIQRELASGLLIYVLLLVLLSVLLARSIVHPVEELSASTRSLAAGDLEHRIQVKGTQEIERLGETLNQMARRLQVLEGMRRQYVSDVSHELRTPLASIRGMAETIVQHAARDPQLVDRYMPRIIAQTDRLARLASQVLDLAQIESGTLLTELSRVSVRSLVDQALHATMTAAEEKGVDLQADVADPIPEIQGDPDRLVQVLINLIGNAVRHTPSGGRVLLTARGEAGQVVVTVRDTGEGIPGEHLPFIFERFYRVDPARTRSGGGSGLGLSIVKQIVAAHGGQISVKSVVGEGTTFEVALPASGSGTSARVTG